MFTGTVIKYNTKRKFNVIMPDKWGSTRMDILFETANFDKFKLGDKVEYNYTEVNGKRYAEKITKIG